MMDKNKWTEESLEPIIRLVESINCENWRERKDLILKKVLLLPQSLLFESKEAKIEMIEQMDSLLSGGADIQSIRDLSWKIDKEERELKESKYRQKDASSKANTDPSLASQFEKYISHCIEKGYINEAKGLLTKDIKQDHFDHIIDPDNLFDLITLNKKRGAFKKYVKRKIIKLQ